MKRLLLTVLAGFTAVACVAAPADDASDSTDDALTNAGPGYFVLVRVNATKNKGDAFIAPANGGTMKCAGGNTASSCLATIDASAVAGPDGAALAADEAAAAKASFLAGKTIVQGTFGKSGNVLAAAKAWSAVGSAPSAASSDKLWLVAPSAARFKDTELGTATVRYATALDLSRLALTADVETKARATASTSGVVARGVHKSGTTVFVADSLYAPVAHVGTAASGLTAAEAATALHDIDNECGDTWCDGDYNFRFDTLTCDFTAGTCVIGLATTYPNDGSDDATWTPGSCTLTAGYHAYADLVTVMTPTYSSITEALSNDMYNCTQSVEATVAK